MKFMIYINYKYFKTDLLCKFEKMAPDQYVKINGRKYCTSSSQLLILQTHLMHAIGLERNIYYHPLFKSVPYSQNIEQQTNNFTPVVLSIICILQFVFSYLEVVSDKKHGFVQKYRQAGNVDLHYLLFKFLFCFCSFVVEQAVFIAVVYSCSVTQISIIQPGHVVILILLIGLYSTAFGLLIASLGSIKTSMLLASCAMMGVVLQVVVF